MGSSFGTQKNITSQINSTKLIFDSNTKQIKIDNKSIIIILCDIENNNKQSIINNIKKKDFNNIVNKIDEGWYLKINLSTNINKNKNSSNNKEKSSNEKQNSSNNKEKNSNNTINSQSNIVESILVSKVFTPMEI
jgi:hypothetical protein